MTSKQICSSLFGSLTETECGNRVTYEAKMIADQVNQSSMISGREQQNLDGSRRLFQDLQLIQPNDEQQEEVQQLRRHPHIQRENPHSHLSQLIEPMYLEPQKFTQQEKNQFD